MAQFGRVIDTRRPSSGEVRATEAAILGRWNRFQVIAVGDGIAPILRDIDDRKQAERALSENRAFLQNLLDLLPLPVFAQGARSGGKGTHLFWNRAAEGGFHKPAKEVIGKTGQDILTKAEAERSDVQDAQIVSSGTPGRFFDQVFDGPQGHRYFGIFKAPIVGADGDIDHLLVIAEDVTEQRAYAERLRLVSRMVVETADAVVITDECDRMIDVNPAFTAMTGYALANVEFHPAIDAGLPPIPLFLRHAEPVDVEDLERSHRWVGEARQTRRDGRLIDVWLSASLILDTDGRLTHHSRVFSDISALKGHEKQLEAMARLDSLTGLPNRRSFDERLAEGLHRTKRSDATLTLMFIDLDGF